MGKIQMEDEYGAERLKDIKKYKKEKITCINCKNQTFILTKCIDFPFFDCLCSKCGSIMVA